MVATVHPADHHPPRVTSRISPRVISARSQADTCATSTTPGRIPETPATAWPRRYPSAVANGHGIALAPESAARYYARPGITYRLVAGLSPSQVAVAWPPANDTNPVVQDFVRCSLENKPPHHLRNQPDQQ